MRRPWNITNSSVYSLATYVGEQVNMNICTYVMAVSRQPKLYACAIEEGTFTWQNLQDNNIAVLQILAANQTNLIRPLGKRSGKDYDKENYLQKRDLLTEWHSKKVLKNATAYVLFEKQEQITTGDHELFIFKALKYKTLSEDNLLLFSDLIEQKIIL